MRWLAARRVGFAAVATAAAALLTSAVRRVLATLSPPPAGERPDPAVTPAEREAAWAARAAQAMLERRSIDLAESRRETGRLEERLASVEQHAATIEEQLAIARRHLTDHTAVANENLRLRGAVDALTDAIAALHRSAAEGGVSAALEEEVEDLRAELLAMELQVKELAEERDRVVEEADRLRAALDAASRDGDAGTERRLRLELDHVRRSLEVERRRNLRLGSRRRDATD
jgi:predicted  nucleic acid-binding Zn-ribbon protein